MLKLMQVELLKTRRSLSLLMLFFCPLAVVLLQTMMIIKTQGAAITDKGWDIVWLSATSLWCYFMLPLFIALITALLNGNEHKNSTWRLMLTLPIQKHSLYLAKLSVAVVYIFAGNLILYLFISCSIVILNYLGINGGNASIYDAFKYPEIIQILILTFSCMPIVLLQHLASWRISNIVFPLALGVIATMGIIQVGSSEFWKYYPWSYITIANVASAEINQNEALILSAIVSIVILVFSMVWVYREETAS